MDVRSAAQLLRQTDHRPLPLRKGRWIMHQSWRDLLFAHWPVHHATLRRHVPPQLELEEHSGRAWVGLIPFRVAQLHPRRLPALPVISNFPEVNLRTYVRIGDTPGVFFFSLDAASRLTVLGARLFYRLPYHLARMHIEKTDDSIEYRSRRRLHHAELNAAYRPVGPPYQAEQGTLEHFLTERYVLFSVTRTGVVLRGDIHHRPWNIQAAKATIRRNTITNAAGLDIGDGPPPVLHYAVRQDTLFWPPTRVP